MDLRFEFMLFLLWQVEIAERGNVRRKKLGCGMAVWTRECIWIDNDVLD